MALEPTNKRPVFIRFINTPDIPKKEFYTHWEAKRGPPRAGGSLVTKEEATVGRRGFETGTGMGGLIGDCVGGFVIERGNKRLED